MPKFINERAVDDKSLSFYARFKVLKNYLPSNAQVLEIGCGNGMVTQALVDRGNQVLGIDYDKAVVNKLKRSEIKAKFQLADIMTYNPNKKFDWIVCSEVLEHLENDIKALKLMYKWLNPHGHILLTVPGYKYYPEIHYPLGGHIRHYKIDQLTKKVTQVGFRVKDKKLWGSLFRLLTITYLYKPALKISANHSRIWGSSIVLSILRFFIDVDLFFFPFHTEILLVLNK